MRKLLLISVSALLLVTTGCVTALKMEIQSSHPIEEWNNTFWTNTIVENYDNLEGGFGGSGSDIFKAEAINLETGEKFHAGGFPNEYIAVFNTLKGCSKLFNSICVISRTNDSTIYANVDDYKEKEEERLTLLKEQERQERMAYKEIEEKRLFNLEQHRIRKAEYQRKEKERIVAELRERCASYGFSGDENIAACIQREAQHELELEQQRIASNREMEALHRQTQNQLAQQRQSQNIQTQVVEEEIPWILQFLGDVAMGVAEGYAHDAIYHNDKPKVIYRNCDVYKC